jgi:hypothetical protein
MLNKINKEKKKRKKGTTLFPISPYFFGTNFGFLQHDQKSDKCQF